MKRRAISVGDKTYEGQFHRITAAGDIQINNSSVKRLYSAGNVKIKKSVLNRLRVAGNLEADSSQLGQAKIVGDLICRGICQGTDIAVIGNLQADLLECRNLRCSTTGKRVQYGGISPITEWHGQLQAETFEHFHPFRLTCDYTFKHILSASLLISPGEIDCEHFYAFDQVQAEAINAEKVFLLAHPETSVQVLTGSQIKVSSQFKPDPDFRRISKTGQYKRIKVEGALSHIDTIEGDKIEIDHVRAAAVSGMDVDIGDLCVIDRVEYQSSVRISEKAVVSEVHKI